MWFNTSGAGEIALGMNDASDMSFDIFYGFVLKIEFNGGMKGRTVFLLSNDATGHVFYSFSVR